MVWDLLGGGHGQHFFQVKKGERKKIAKNDTREKSDQPGIPSRYSDPEAWDVHSLDWGDVLLSIPCFHGGGPHSVTFFSSIWKKHKAAKGPREHRNLG